MADNTADLDWVDCNALRADEEAGGNRQRLSGQIGDRLNDEEFAWRPRGLLLIEPDGTEKLVPPPAWADGDAQADDQQQAERAAKAKADAKAKAEQEAAAAAKAKAKADAAAKAKADEKARAEQKAREEKQRKAEKAAAALAAAAEKAKAEAEAKRKANEEAAKAKAEAEAKAAAEKKAKEEADRKAKETAEREAKEAAERKARAEAEAKAAAEQKAREEAERKAQEEAEKKAKAEAERKAKEEAAKKAKGEAEAKAKRDAEAKAKAAAEKKAREEAAAKAKAEAAAKAAAEKRAREEAEKKTKAEAERKAKLEAEKKAKAEAAAKLKAKKEAEAKARAEAEAKAKAEAEEKARKKAEEKARAEAEAKAAEEAKAKAAAEAEAAKEAERKAEEDAIAARAKAKNLGKTFRRLIRETGPISLAQYMGESNARYYDSRDPLGDDGDFITAPEISQMFGELVGLWLADVWVKMGASDNIHYVELGPGRGTLTKDVLRTAGKYGFDPQVHFVEGSMELRKLQRQAVPSVHFHNDLSTLPDDRPLLIVANEFFDALPIHQLVRSANGWHERMIGLEGDNLAFVAGDKPMDTIVPKSWRSAAQGSMIETSPAAATLMAEISQRLVNQGGVALIIDYGPSELRAGSTLQALKDHQKVDPLTNAGEADMTAHVDFEMLQDVAASNGADVMGLQAQGEWLQQLHIDTRLEALKRKSPAAADEVQRQRDRLVNDDQMGLLFKVLGVCGRRWPMGEGFK